MSQEINWQPGIPTVDGIYWYDAGFRGAGISNPLILDFRNGYGFVFGNGGSGPLSSFYTANLSCARHAIISPPINWVPGSAIKGQNNRAWIKGNKYFGFGIVTRGWHDDMLVTVAWIESPNNTGFSSGGYLHDKDGYFYSLAEEPIIDK